MLKKYSKKTIEKIRFFSNKYQAYIVPIFLIGGFLFDLATLRRVDGIYDNIVLITHILIIGACITILFSKDTVWGRRVGIYSYARRIQYLMLFSFGAVFSGSIVFYSKSASFSSSWPLFLILLSLMLGVEFQRKYFQRLVLQINFYFIAVFSYLIVLVPVLRKEMGPSIFMASGVLALIFISVFFLILYSVNSQKLFLYFRKMMIGIMSIFILFNFLYFTNIIPPIPLSLKFSGVYHSVYRSSQNSYVATYEKTSAWNIFRKRSRVVHREDGASVFVFASIFAPINLNTKIYHQWQYYDSISYEWVDSTRIEIGITGGREEGFRGYSFKRNLHNGKWRVLIETERGQKLGRINFKIKSRLNPVDLVEEVL